MKRITVGRLKERLNRLPDDCVLIFSRDGDEAYIQDFQLQSNNQDTLEPTLVNVGLEK